MPLCRKAGMGKAPSTPASPHARGQLAKENPAGRLASDCSLPRASSVKTTMDNYATPSERDLEAAVNPYADDDDDFE